MEPGQPARREHQPPCYYIVPVHYLVFVERYKASTVFCTFGICRCKDTGISNQVQGLALVESPQLSEQFALWGSCFGCTSGVLTILAFTCIRAGRTCSDLLSTLERLRPESPAAASAVASVVAFVLARLWSRVLVACHHAPPPCEDGTRWTVSSSALWAKVYVTRDQHLCMD